MADRGGASGVIVTIMQPAYLPWLGFFDRIRRSELFIVLDHVAPDRNSKTKTVNRNRIRIPTGWTWLTVPLQTKGLARDLVIEKLKIEPCSNWRHKHWRAIELNYSRARFFGDVASCLRPVFQHHWTYLSELNQALTTSLLACLGLSIRQIASSQLLSRGRKQSLILDLCHEVGATTYISGPFGRDYLNTAQFERAGIELLFHDYKHPVYGQVFPGFEPYMSIIDLLFCQGPESLATLSACSALARN
jgi:WbqC-like protein family